MTIKIDLKKLQSALPEYLQKVEAGDTVVVCRGRKRIAEIRPVKKKKRPVGLGKDEIWLAPNCFDPLPDDLLDAFEGKAK
jgi:antitoxin (DNA-binding transcriptional repressor) of toxin-antitoxin stability system